MNKNFFFSVFLGLLIVTLLFGLSLSVTAEEPKYGGTLRMCNIGRALNALTFNNTDWVWKHGYDTGMMVEHLFMGDLQKGPRGTNEYAFEASAWIPPEVMTGELVESWEKSTDPLQLIFHLRKGVFWQEKPGVMKRREFVADDVVYSQTALKKGRKAIPTYVTFVERWEAKDKYTVIAHLNEWNANWPYRIGWGYYDAIQAPEQEATGNPRDWKNLCGTGPYMLADYKDAHSYVWKKNKDYWGKTPINGKEYQLPFCDEVIYMIIKDPQTRISALRTGKIDMDMGIDSKDVASIKKSCPDLIWKKYITLGGRMVALRMDTKPFDDIRVRRALNLAVNQQAMIDALMNGEGEIVNYPFPFTFKSVYTPLKELPPSAQELFSYNPEKAKKLLAEAGYPNGFTFKTQILNTSPLYLDMGQMVVAFLADVGVTMELEIMDYASYLSMMYKKQHGPGYFFSNDHGNPFATIRKNFVTGQTWNPYMMADKHVDETFFKTVSDPNLSDKEAYEIMKKLSVYCIDQAPAIWLPGQYEYAAWWPWVKNYYGELRVGAWRAAPIFARIWVDQDLKKKMGY